jgi:hypothetical protein
VKRGQKTAPFPPHPKHVCLAALLVGAPSYHPSLCCKDGHTTAKRLCQLSYSHPQKIVSFRQALNSLITPTKIIYSTTNCTEWAGDSQMRLYIELGLGLKLVKEYRPLRRRLRWLVVGLGSTPRRLDYACYALLVRPELPIQLP